MFSVFFLYCVFYFTFLFFVFVFFFLSSFYKEVGCNYVNISIVLRYLSGMGCVGVGGRGIVGDWADYGRGGGVPDIKC